MRGFIYFYTRGNKISRFDLMEEEGKKGEEGACRKCVQSVASRRYTCLPSWSHSLRARMASRGRSTATAAKGQDTEGKKEEDRREKKERRRWERDAGSARDRMWAAVYQLEDDTPRCCALMKPVYVDLRARRSRRCTRKKVSKLRSDTAIFTSLFSISHFNTF